MPQKKGQGQENNGKRNQTKKKQLEEYFATN